MHISVCLLSTIFVWPPSPPLRPKSTTSGAEDPIGRKNILKNWQCGEFYSLHENKCVHCFSVGTSLHGKKYRHFFQSMYLLEVGYLLIVLKSVYLLEVGFLLIGVVTRASMRLNSCFFFIQFSIPNHIIYRNCTCFIHSKKHYHFLFLGGRSIVLNLWLWFCLMLCLQQHIWLLGILGKNFPYFLLGAPMRFLYVWKVGCHLQKTVFCYEVSIF